MIKPATIVMIRIFLVMVLMHHILPATGQNCNVDFPGTATRTFSGACGGSSVANLELGKNINMSDGDTFTFDVAIVNINGNLHVDAEGNGKIIIPAGVTVNVDGNVQFHNKNGQCTSANPCVFEIVVNGNANFTDDVDNDLVTLVWSGTGTVVVGDNFKNSSDGCMDCGAGGCPNIQVNPWDCDDDGSGCSGGDFCTRINSCSSDVTAPVIASCPSDRVVNMTGPGCTQTVSWTDPIASDNCALESFTPSHSPGVPFSEGLTTVIYTATDVAGNTSTCSFTVSVVDNVAPVITGCPANITVNANGSCKAVVNWTAPSFTDNCPGGTLTTPSPPNSTFNTGITTVVYTARDVAGNTSTCSFNVTVIDNTAPIITGCPANITVNANGSCKAVVNWTAPTFTDNCPGGTLTTTKASGSTFNAGTTTVVYTARDVAGNTASCSFNVTVVDNAGPVMVGCPANITVTANGSCQGIGDWTPPTPLDNCSSVVVTNSHSPGDIFPVGTTEVTYTATDESGNTSTCSFNIIVDETPPLISNCPNDIAIKADESWKAIVEWTKPEASVVCGEISWTNTHSPGELFDVGATKVTYEARDDFGNTSHCSFNVIVSQMDIEIEISKVVTPDGDGINDSWTISDIQKFKNNSVVVVDRWGGVIFTGSGYDNETVVWSGSNQRGGLVPTGTYFYTVSVTFGSARVEKSGFIELIR